MAIPSSLDGVEDNLDARDEISELTEAREFQRFVSAETNALSDPVPQLALELAESPVTVQVEEDVVSLPVDRLRSHSYRSRLREVVNQDRKKYIALVLKTTSDVFHLALSFFIGRSAQQMQADSSSIIFPSTTNADVEDLLRTYYIGHLDSERTGAIIDGAFSGTALGIDLYTIGSVFLAIRGSDNSARDLSLQALSFGLARSGALSLGRIIDVAGTFRSIQNVLSDMKRMEDRGAFIPQSTKNNLTIQNIEVITAVSVSAVFLAGMIIFIVPVKNGRTLYDYFRGTLNNLPFR